MRGPVYATTAELGEFLGSTPADADRLLWRASRLVDELLVGAVYATDDAGAPTDTAVADALADAVVLQAAYVHEGGDPAEGGGPVTSVSIGSVRIQREPGAGSAGAVDGQPVAPGVVTVLRLAGLLPVEAYVTG